MLKDAANKDDARVLGLLVGHLRGIALPPDARGIRYVQAQAKQTLAPDVVNELELGGLELLLPPRAVLHVLLASGEFSHVTNMLEDRLSARENPRNKIGRMVSADERYHSRSVSHPASYLGALDL